MECSRCQKPDALCLCAMIHPQKNLKRIIILQHPQEPDKILGTARLAHLALQNSELKIGLSWPNLKKATSDPNAESSKWGVLYLGSGMRDRPTTQGVLQLVNKGGTPLPNSDQILSELTGLIVLDGTWSQAKTLWWRNAWLLKLRRAILLPTRPSLYRELRKEPRRECLSTLESIGLSLTAMGETSAIQDHLVNLFEKLLSRAKENPQLLKAATKPKK